MELWKRNLVILWIALFMFMAAMSLILPFLPLYLQEDLGLSGSKNLTVWTGLVFGANFLTAFIFSPVWGALADRVGRKVMILRSGFGMAIVTVLMGFAQTPEQLLLLRLINGMISGFIPASIALVSTNTPRERSGYALGILQSGTVAGSIIGPSVGGLIADILGFRMVFYVTGTFLFLATVLVLFTVKEINKPNPREKKGEGFKKDFKKIISSGPMLALFSTGLLLQFSMMSTITLITLFVQDIIHNPARIAFFAGLVSSVTGIANMSASPILGRLGDRYGSQHVLYFSLLGAAIFMLPHAFVTNIWALLIVRFLLGLCVGGMLPSVNALIRKFAPDGLESTTFGYSNSAQFIGNMTGPIVAGFLAGFIGIRGIFVFAAVLLFVNFLWVKIQVIPKVASGSNMIGVRKTR